jgi:hypothetical protein
MKKDKIPPDVLLNDWTEYIEGLVKYGLMPKDIKEYTIDKEKKIREPKQQVALAIMKLRKGYELDPSISISTCLNQIMIVNGKLEIYAQLALALIRKFSPESRIQYVTMNNAKAELKVKRYKDQEYWNPYDFNKNEAELADLWITPEKLRADKRLNNSPWKKYPKTMLLYSAIRLMVKFEFSDIVLLDVANVYETESKTYDEQDLLHEGSETPGLILPKKEEVPLLLEKEKKVVKVKKTVKKEKKSKEEIKKIIDVEPEKPKKEEPKIKKEEPKEKPKSQNNLDTVLDLNIIEDSTPIKSKKKNTPKEEEFLKIVNKKKTKSKWDWDFLNDGKKFSQITKGKDYYRSIKNKSKFSQDFPAYLLQNNIVAIIRDMGRNPDEFSKFFGENLHNKKQNQSYFEILLDTYDDFRGLFDVNTQNKLIEALDKRNNFKINDLVKKLIILTKEILEKKELSSNDFVDQISERTGWKTTEKERKFHLWAYDFLRSRDIIIVKDNIVRLG